MLQNKYSESDNSTEDTPEPTAEDYKNVTASNPSGEKSAINDQED